MLNSRVLILDFPDIGDFDTLQQSLYEAPDRHTFDPDSNVIRREPLLVKTALRKFGAAVMYDAQNSRRYLAATFAYEAGKKRLRERGLKVSSLAEIGSSLSRQKGLGKMTVAAITVAEYLAHGHDHVMVAAIQPGNEKSRRTNPATGKSHGAYGHFDKIIDSDYAAKLFEVTRAVPPPPGAKDFHIFTQNTLACYVADLRGLRDYGLKTPDGYLRVLFSERAQERLPTKDLDRIAALTTPPAEIHALRFVG